MHSERLLKRLQVLEAQCLPSIVPDCDWRRRLAKCNALLRGEEWTCPVPMTPERVARKAAKQAQCQEYFDKLYANDERRDDKGGLE